MDYPEVNLLIDAVKKMKITVSPGQELIETGDFCYNWVQFNIGSESVNLPFMDEYDDARNLNPVVMLNMALEECEMIEETAEFAEWCKDSGVKHDHPNASKLYFYLKKTTEEFRQIVGNELEPIPYFDIELNTGKARALREAVAE